MKSEEIERNGPGFEQYEDDINWTAGVGRPAGVYWLNGRTVIAGHATQAEDRLLDAGAVLVATLRFDADPLESTHRGRDVRRVPARSASRRWLLSGVN